MKSVSRRTEVAEAKQRQAAVKETKFSRTDQKAGYMVCEGKPKGFFYLDHRTLTLTSPSSPTHLPRRVHDSVVYLDRQVERVDF